MSDFKNGFTFKIGNGADPEVFTALERMRVAPQIGEENELIDTTDFDSTSREYIGGLADGQLLTIDCKKDLSSGTQQAVLVGHVTARTNVNCQAVWTDGTDTTTFAFAVTAIGYSNQPSYEDVNMISFTLKITGAITES
tara:strand:+ start:129 stop:545 length:417 start_codon:yes stop_codon:yes gene_type:complete